MSFSHSRSVDADEGMVHSFVTVVAASEAHPVTMPDEQPARKPRRFTLPVSAAIAAIAALAIVAVAALTLSITVTSSHKAVDAVGRLYVEALAADGDNMVTTYVCQFADVARGISDVHLTENVLLPADAPTPTGADGRPDYLQGLDAAAAQLLLLRRVLPHLNMATLLYDDGSIVDAQPVGADGLLNIGVSNFGKYAAVNATSATTPNASDFARLTSRHQGNLTTVLQTPRVTPPRDGRYALYRELRGLVSAIRGAIFLPLYAFDGFSGLSLAMPVVSPLFNRSAFIGAAVVTMDLAAVSEFLHALHRTPNAHAFLLDGVPSIIAATTSASIASSFATNESATTTLPPHCATTATVADIAEIDGSGGYTVVCRALPHEYPYPPLNAIAADAPTWLRPATGTTAVRTIEAADGERYYVVSAGLQCARSVLRMGLLLVMPESDILGGVIAARNQAMAGAAGCTVVLAALCAVGIAWVLRPLQDVANRMRRAARLEESTSREDDQSGHGSLFSEVHELQTAYAQLSTAISSFTRYVPRDVVKDLMASGELCSIKMAPRMCTMLFVDIAGFTSMCERVATDQLGELVRLYFERMTALVMGHAGLVDKYIGDAIMAVWGAPFAVANAEVKAVLCALRISREVKVAPLTTRFEAEGETLGVRVGVASGEVLAGNMGSAERMSYTVIGDAVNLAARLEALNKQFGTEVLMCERTARAVNDAIVSRALVKIRVVGKSDAVRAFEPVGVVDHSTTAASEEADYTTKPTSSFDPDPELIARLDTAEQRAARDGVRWLSSFTLARTAAPPIHHGVPIAPGVDQQHESEGTSAETIDASDDVVDPACQPAHCVRNGGRYVRASSLLRAAGALTEHPLRVTHADAMNARRFEDAMEYVSESDFASAAALIESADDTASKAFVLGLCHEWLRSPPGAASLGVWTADSK